MDRRDVEDDYNGPVDTDSKGSAQPTSRSATGTHWSPTERAVHHGARGTLDSQQQLHDMSSGHASGRYPVQISHNGLLLGAAPRNVEVAAAAAQRKPLPAQLQLSNGQQRAGNAVRVTDWATPKFQQQHRTVAAGEGRRLEDDLGRDSHRAQPLALDLNLSSASARNARALSHAEQLAAKEWALGFQPAVSRFCLAGAVRA